MKKVFLITLLILFTSLVGCVEENEEDKGPYKYELTIDNVQDFMVIRITDVKVVMENFVQYDLNIEINIDDEEGDPTTLLLIAFEIDIDIVLNFTNEEDEVIYLEQNFILGSGAEGKDKVITQSKQISFLEYSIENYEILFDSIRWNLVSGDIILSEKYK